LNTIFYRVFSRYVFIILFLSLVIFLFSFSIIRSNHIETLSNSLENLAVSLEDQVMNRMENPDALDQFVKEKGGNINARITVILSDGVVLADSETDPQSMDNHADRPEIRESFHGKTGKSVRFSSTVQAEMLYIAHPLTHQDKTLGVLRLSLFLEEINQLLTTLRFRFLAITLIFIAIALILALYFAR